MLNPFHPSFSLVFIFSGLIKRNTGLKKLTFIKLVCNPLLVNFTILNVLKTPGNSWLSSVFMGYKIKTMRKNGLKTGVESVNPSVPIPDEEKKFK